MPKSWFISSVLAVLLSGAISVPTVSACGGVKAFTVVMPFEPAAYMAELSGKRLPYVQFDSHFRIQDGPAPRIDGKIEAPEWADAGHAVLTVGTRHTQVQEYG